MTGARQKLILISFPTKANIEDLDIHFIKGINPLPLLLTHGPGSVFEFVHLIEPPTDPAKLGGDPDDAFTLVIPSPPGGFSAKPKQPIGPVTTARL